MLWENNILIYCILNAELNIILLHWNKQHFERSIIKWGSRLLDENFHLVLMFTCFGNVQICVELNVEPSGLHCDTALAYKADICTWWKGIPVQWFSELFFDFFLSILAIDIFVFIDVVDLIHQIIEFGKDRYDRYWKSVKFETWTMGDRNLFLPSPSERTPFPVALKAEHCSEQHKTYHSRTGHQWLLRMLR